MACDVNIYCSQQGIVASGVTLIAFKHYGHPKKCSRTREAIYSAMKLLKN